MDDLDRAMRMLGVGPRCVDPKYNSFNPGIRYTSRTRQPAGKPKYDFKIYDHNSHTHYYFKVNKPFGKPSHFGVILECDIYTRKSRERQYNQRKQLLKVMGETDIVSLKNELKLTVAMSREGISPPAGPFFWYPRKCPRNGDLIRQIRRTCEPHVRDVAKVERIFGRPFLGLVLIDKINGVPLFDYNRRAGGAEQQAMYTRVCELIQRMHTLNIVHGDLHQNNILVSQPDGRPYLIDWGLSHNVTSTQDWQYGGPSYELGNTCSVRKYYEHPRGCNRDNRVHCPSANWNCERMGQSKITYEACRYLGVGLPPGGVREETHMPASFHPSEAPPVSVATPARARPSSRHSQTPWDHISDAEIYRRFGARRAEQAAYTPMLHDTSPLYHRVKLEERFYKKFGKRPSRRLSIAQLEAALSRGGLPDMIRPSPFGRKQERQSRASAIPSAVPQRRRRLGLLREPPKQPTSPYPSVVYGGIDIPREETLRAGDDATVVASQREETLRRATPMAQRVFLEERFNKRFGRRPPPSWSVHKLQYALERGRLPDGVLIPRFGGSRKNKKMRSKKGGKRNKKKTRRRKRKCNKKYTKKVKQ